MAESPKQGAPREAEPERQSIGRYLAAQRQLRGISLDELAARTRIPRRSLERLEAGAFDADPDGFVRGFVRTVALALGLDPREAVLRLVSEPKAADEDWLRMRRLRVGLAVAVLAGAALLAAFWGLRSTVRWISAPSGDPVGERVYRRDAVRALADEAAKAAPPDAPAPAEP